MTSLKPLTVCIMAHCGTFLKRLGVTDPLTCLLRSRHASQEAAVRTGHGTVDRLQIEKAAHQGCILSPCLFNFYAEYIMRNAGLDEAQAGRITSQNRHCREKYQQPQICIRYHSNGRKWRRNKESCIRVKEESEKVGLKLNIQKLRSWHLVPSLHGK